jgi:hypothetical protein
MKVQLISPTSYCPEHKRPFDKLDLIKEAVRVEDIFNHPYVPVEIPKLRYPQPSMTPISIRALFSAILP